jgi:hypothetical protein
MFGRAPTKHGKRNDALHNWQSFGSSARGRLSAGTEMDLLCSFIFVMTVADYELVCVVTRHIQEIEMIRSKVYSLEQQHVQVKAK